MAVTPDVLHGAAEDLSNGREEVDWRNAVSRAYYAAYHRCKQLAPNAAGQFGVQGGSHESLCRALMDIRRPTAVRRVGIMLDHCRKYRNVADYDIGDAFPRATCLTVMQSTKSILEQVESLD